MHHEINKKNIYVTKSEHVTYTYVLLCNVYKCKDRERGIYDYYLEGRGK